MTPRRTARTTPVQPSRLLRALLLRVNRWLSQWFQRQRNNWRRWRDESALASAGLRFETLEPRLLMSADWMPRVAAEAFAFAPVLPGQEPAAERHVVEPEPGIPADEKTPASPSEPVFQTLGGAANVAASVSVAINGPGSAELVLQEGRYSLSLRDTTSASLVRLVVNGHDGRIEIGEVNAASAIGTLDLSAADLRGTAQLTGGVNSLSVGEIHGAHISVAGNAPLTLQAASVTASRLQAAALKSLVVAGDFNADLVLTGSAAAPFTLDSVQITGNVGAGLWSITGRANNLQLGSTGAAWRANVTGTLSQLTTRGDMAGQLAAAGLQLLQVGGSMRGATLLVGANLGSDAELGGSGSAADRFGTGTLARVRVSGDIIDSRLVVGIDPVNGVLFDGDDRALGNAAQRIQEFTVGGLLRGATSIVAPAWPATVRIGGQPVAASTVPNFATLPSDVTAPIVTLALRLDSGDANNDRITQDPTILATVIETTAGVTLQARVGTSAAFQAVTATRDASGRWVLDQLLRQADGSLFDDGPHTVQVRALDAAGNLSAVSTLTLQLDTRAPAPSLALANDSGRLATDRITRDGAISGNVGNPLQTTRLWAALDPVGDVPASVEFTTLVQADGSFSITAAQMAELAGGVLADGVHLLRVATADVAGNRSANVDLRFTLDTTAPAASARFGVSVADALAGDDGRTRAAFAVLTGSAEPGATIRLAAQDLATLVGSNGQFQLAGVALVEGTNTLTLTVSDAAGNEREISRTLTRDVQAHADPVLEWINIGLASIQRDATDPPIASRILAIQSIAVYDSLAALQGTPAYLVQRSVTGAVSADAAAVAAAHRVLSQLYPAQRGALDIALAASLAAIPEGAAKTAGLTLGRSVAEAVLAIRANDGALNLGAEQGGTAPGQWRPTGPAYLIADEPNWGQVTPFALSSGDQFRAAPPPALDSAAYAEAVNEVRQLGAASGSTRSADQTEQAHFWADGAGSYSPPGHWNQIAAQVAAAQSLGTAGTARLMVQLNIALADAAIAAWDTKFTFDSWRPVSAIHEAANDGNAGTTVDATWQPLLITPPHPDYVSGHSTFSAAAAQVLASTFGDNTAFSTTSATLLGVTRSFTSFSQAAAEAGASRIYGGIHTRPADTAGEEIGRNVAALVLARFEQTQDSQAPNIVLAASPAAVRQNITVAGEVIDNLAGVASVELRVDEGGWQTLALDAQGGFSVNTAFALDGSADGPHSVQLRARDVAGNLSATSTRSLLLDTRAPVQSLISIAEGAVLDDNSRLVGEASSAAPIVSLRYAFDDAAAQPVGFDTSTGRFDEALLLGNLSVGAHTLRITALDAAGNTSILTRNVSLAALAPLTVTRATPTEGSDEVGVTYRPQVFFSRAVNPATLTADSFYATGPDGVQLPATLVPSQDGSFVWMFFRDPLPASARITLHLNGNTLRAAADGQALDGDGDGVAGGNAEWAFTTVSTAAVTGTRLVGKVVDPGADQLPMSFDDIRRGPDGVIHTADDVFLNPIAGARVFVIGRPDLVTTTDADGNFAFDNLPVGNVKVGIDGRTASNAPAGVFFPEMVMDVNLRPAVNNTLMGTMGALEMQRDNLTRGEVYLPRVQSAALQPVDNNAATTITVAGPSAPGLTDEKRAQLSLTVAPGSAIGVDGRAMNDVRVGINTVPLELVKDMLPSGVLATGFFLTIQAPGVETFSAPMQITGPNLSNAAPGSKLNVLSFDHTTGRLAVSGTATVSADGKSVVSDAGSGVFAPGWHGFSAPGGGGEGEGGPGGPQGGGGGIQGGPLPYFGGMETDRVFSFDSNTDSFQLFINNLANAGSREMFVRVTVEGNTGDKRFLAVENKQQFFVRANTNAHVLTFKLDAQVHDEIVLFGARIKVEAWDALSVNLAGPVGEPQLRRSMLVYALEQDVTFEPEVGYVELPQVSRSHVGDTIPFRRAMPNGVGAIVTLEGHDFAFDQHGIKVPERNEPGQAGSRSIGGRLVVQAPNGDFITDMPLVSRLVDGYRFSIDRKAFSDEMIAWSGTDSEVAAFIELFVPLDQYESPAWWAFIDDFGSQVAQEVKRVFRTAQLDAVSPVFEVTFGLDLLASVSDRFAVIKLGPMGPDDSVQVVRVGADADTFQAKKGQVSATSFRQQGLLLSQVVDFAIEPEITLDLLSFDDNNFSRFVQTELSRSAPIAGPIFTSRYVGQAIAQILGARMGALFDISSRLDVMNVPTPFESAFNGDVKAAIGYALGLPVSQADVGYTFARYQANLRRGDFDVERPIDTGNRYAPPLRRGLVPTLATPATDSSQAPTGHLNILAAMRVPGISAPTELNQLAFTAIADGTGAQTQRQTIHLVNDGLAALQVLQVNVLGGAGAFRLSDAVGAPFTLDKIKASDAVPQFGQRALELVFDPLSEGRFDAVLEIIVDSATGPVRRELRLTGQASAASGRLEVLSKHNNLGGAELGAVAINAAGVLTLYNRGASPLIVNELRVADGAGGFTLVNAAATVSAAQPLVIAPGASFNVDARFLPSRLGLQRASVIIGSNDPVQPQQRFSLVGTGVSADLASVHYADAYVGVQNLDSTAAPAVNLRADNAGRWESFMPFNQRMGYTVFDPVSGLVGSHVASLQRAAGERLPTPVLQASTAPDSDGDGLPDDIEFAIGSNPSMADTNRDGIDDFAAIAQGLNPLGLLAVPVGQLSALPIRGTSTSVAVATLAQDPARTLAFITTTNEGLTIADVSQPGAPIALSRLPLPGGAGIEVAVDSGRALAVVAGGAAGLYIVDVSNPVAPVLRMTVPIEGGNVGLVQLRGGYAYVGHGESLSVVDLNTGEVRRTLAFGAAGQPVGDLAIDGNVLFASGGSLETVLKSYALDGDALTPLGNANLPASFAHLSVGNGIAYVAGGGASGFFMVDVGNPAAMVQLSPVNPNNWLGVAANGSGLAVVTNAAPDGGVIQVLDVSDPRNASRLVNAFNVSYRPRDVVVAGGLAFVLDQASGLQIFNFMPLDTRGVAPTVSITVDAADADPNQAGLQLLEGRALTVRPTITDDVQARSVELLFNGRVVSNNLSFPWNLSALVPSLAQAGASLQVQVRVTDTGGNSALSNLITLPVVRDTVAPRLLSMDISEAAELLLVRSINLRFDEPLDVSRLTTSSVRLLSIDASGVATPVPARLDSRDFGQAISLVPLTPLSGVGRYELRIDPPNIADRAGNVMNTPILRHFSTRSDTSIRAESGTPAFATVPSANPGQRIAVRVPVDPATTIAAFRVVDRDGVSGEANVRASGYNAAAGLAYFVVPQNAVTGDLHVFGEVGSTRTEFPGGTFLLQIVPKLSAVRVQSIAPDGLTAVVALSGAGFIEGAGQYQFGSTTITDTSRFDGPDVNLDGQNTFNVTLTLPLSDGVFGAIRLATDGGTSADLSQQFSAIAGIALSGTPASAAQASANAGQAVTLVGQGLSLTSTALIRWVDVNGLNKFAVMNPVSANADGSRATVLVPAFANGAFGVGLLGSANQPLLQIVPTLASATENSQLTLQGSGFVEGSSTYSFGGRVVVDSSISSGVNVGQGVGGPNTLATIDAATLALHGFGAAVVQTAGGSSAPLAVSTLRPANGTQAVGALRDLAVDAASGSLWASDASVTGRLLRIDANNGSVLQTIALPVEAGSPSSHSAVQVLQQAISLDNKAVPVGSLLVFNGASSPDRVVAINPTTGATVASIAIANYDLTAGFFDAASGELWVVDTRGAGNRIARINPNTGLELGAINLPVALRSDAGMAVHPVTGHLWFAGQGLGSLLVEVNREGNELRRLDAGAQGAAGLTLSGLAFTADGSLLASTGVGTVLRLRLDIDGGVQRATLTSVEAVAASGVAAQAGVAAANVGQVVELQGTNFGAGTRVLFETRDNDGVRGVVSIAPTLINATGTRLQVQVPDVATTGEVRVVNAGASNLAGGTNTDSLYRNVSVSFVASSSTALVNFADGGLQALADESWGIDNVRVTHAGDEVFHDNFEGAANPAWDRNVVDANALGTLSRYAGRFNGGPGQTLNLGGLVTGRSYTLNFDLIVLDSWEGNNALNGPDVLRITVDGQPVWRESFANPVRVSNTSGHVQSYGQSAGVRLQIVPTLAGVTLDIRGIKTELLGSGFQEGASTLSLGGVVFVDGDNNVAGEFNVSGTRNDTMSLSLGTTLDGPIRISTEGGYAELPGAWPAGAPSAGPIGLTLTSVATRGVPADPSKPSANVGQRLNLAGRPFPVQFEATDDSGLRGTYTDGNNVVGGGVNVPALATSGLITSRATGEQVALQVVPVLRAMSGSVVAGGLLTLQGTGMSDPSLVVLVDGTPATTFSLQTLLGDARGTQLLNVTVPAGVVNPVVSVRTAGGSSSIRLQQAAAGADASHLITITALAGSGTAARAQLPSANTGQTISLSGLGLRADDRVVFEVIDAAGNISELSVLPTRVDITAGTLDVVVPDAATTGSVRLARDPVGLFLQIVPTLADLSLPAGSAPATARATLAGTGFSEGLTSVWIGERRIDDRGNNVGLDVRDRAAVPRAVANGEIVFDLPAGPLLQGPLRISTVGGTSAALALTVSALEASANSGAPANPAFASAVPGQTVTLRGAGLDMSSDVVFQVVDVNGQRGEQVVKPSSVNGDGTQVQIAVPTSAVTGALRVLGDRASLLPLLQVVPMVTGMSIQSVAADGLSAVVVLSGLGFIEGGDTEYHFGGNVIFDASGSAGADVANGQVTLTVPMTAGAVGTVVVVTAGGRSAAFTPPGG